MPAPHGGGGGGGGSGGGGAGRGAATQRGGLGGSQRPQQLRTHETPSVQQLREWYTGRGRSGGAGPCAYVLRTGTRSGEVCGLPHTTQRCFGRLTDAWRTQFPDAVDLPRWHDLLLQNVPIFDLDFDAILAAMYALADITEADCYLRVSPDLGTVAAALGASAAATLGASASAAPGAGTSPPSGTAPTESFHTFTLDSGASRSFFRDSTTLTPLRRPVAVSLADPSGGPVLAHSSTVLPCPAAPSGLLSGLHLPSFSTNLVSGADLQDAWVDQFTPGGQRVTHCTCSRTGRHLATLTRRPGSSLYTLTTAPPPVPASGQVAASSQVFAAASRSSPTSAPCSCHPLAHETLLWHHRLGHPSLPRLRGMASRALGHERYFLLVVDDYSRYTTVFPLRIKGEVTEGIRQTFTLPASPQQNGIAERRIGMVMDVARTSMIHAAAPHFLWPFAVQYAAHQINLQPRVSLPETTPTLRWTGKTYMLAAGIGTARYVARGFSQRQGVDFFQTFSPTPKMTTLRVLLHVAAQRDYELHSLDFSTAFLQGSLHEEIWLRRPPGFTGSFPPGTQWSLRRPVYGLRQAPREWHDTLRTTLAALGFAPSTADPSLFLRTDATLPPFYVLVYVDDLVFATADTEALAHVKSELQKRHTCTDLGELTSYLGLRITRDRAQRTITLTQSHMVQHVLQRFGFTYSSPQSTPLPTGHSLSAPPSDESVEPSGPYPELMGCLMYLMTCTRPDLAYPLSLLAHYVAPGRHRKVHWDAAKRVLRYLCSTSGMGLVLGGRARVVLTGDADASWVDDLATQRSSQGYTFSLGSGSVFWRSTRSSSVLSSSCEAEIYVEAMAAQELRWLTYLLTDLGEAPRSPPVLYVDKPFLS
ncbi:unnamed protein product [Closterium sp. NIES-54]